MADYAAYKGIKATGVTGSVRVPSKPVDESSLLFKDEHGAHHGCTLEDARAYIKAAKCSITRKRWDGLPYKLLLFEWLCICERWRWRY